MARFFNTAGLCNPQDHYMVDPLKRLTELEALIEKRLYFTIHAPRQTGKTTLLYSLAKKLNLKGDYIALVVSFERAGFASISTERANFTLIDCVFQASLDQLPENMRPEDPHDKSYVDLKGYIARWCRSQTLPIVLLVDEIDSLINDVLISVLRQFRDGYQSRPQAFPSTVALVGLRDVREYKARIRPDSASLGTASPFNIKAESLFLKNFSQEEVFELLTQHEQETGQMFPPEVKQELYLLSRGQPWLVNALANQIVEKELKIDYQQEITLDIVNQAKNHLIMRRDTHLDSLVDKLKEPRVKRVAQAILNGAAIQFDILDDDIAYLRDLGLVSQTSPLEFANPIYAEIVPRVMASPMEVSIPKEIQTPWFLNPDQTLNIDRVLAEFQKFYRRNSEAWLQRYEYRESAHHLLLMAFLQRIINAGGDIIREMALGNERIDMLVRFGRQEFALELKVYRDNHTLEDGQEQLARYLDKLGLEQGYLVIFDPREKSWEEKIYRREMEFLEKKLILIGV